MHILIAPNAFKNSLDAANSALAISRGLEQSDLSCTVKLFPIADGGDGTAPLLANSLQGEWIPVTVNDPLGRKMESAFCLADKGRLAIIELANASGLRLLSPAEYDPLRATTFGTGQLIQAALESGVTNIILCIGGSATVDGGAGIMCALGIRFLNSAGDELDGSPASFSQLSAIDTSALNKKMGKATIHILCDVQNQLLGPAGASAVFGPQKGARPAIIPLLEASLSRLCAVIKDKTGKDISHVKHGGAAGGVAAGLYGLLDAKLVNGIDHFLHVTGFERELAKAHLVITGEGSLDEQTLEGKGPMGVALQAKELGVPVVGMAGKITAHHALEPYFDTLITISEKEIDLQTALKNTALNLEKAGRMLGDRLAKG